MRAAIGTDAATRAALSFERTREGVRGTAHNGRRPLQQPRDNIGDRLVSGKRGAAVERPAQRTCSRAMRASAKSYRALIAVRRSLAAPSTASCRSGKVAVVRRYPSRARTPDRTVSKGSRIGPHAAHARVTVGNVSRGLSVRAGTSQQMQPASVAVREIQLVHDLPVSPDQRISGGTNPDRRFP